VSEWAGGGEFGVTADEKKGRVEKVKAREGGEGGERGRGERGGEGVEERRKYRKRGIREVGVGRKRGGWGWRRRRVEGVM